MGCATMFAWIRPTLGRSRSWRGNFWSSGQPVASGQRRLLAESRERDLIPLHDSAAFQRWYVGLLPLSVSFFLGVLLLAACGDSATPRSGPQQETTVQHPGLRPRAASSESLPAQPPASTPAPTQVTSDSTIPPPGLTPSTSPPFASPPSNAPVIQVAAGENHWCALQQDGRVRCWGPNDQGQLNVPDDVRFRQITSGWRFSCGLRTDGEITCWGRKPWPAEPPPASSR